MANLWNELHTRALEFEKKLGHNGVDELDKLTEHIKKEERLYLHRFGMKIPRYTKGCKCQEFWNNWYKANPPTFDKYFEWTVKTHNAVNKKLHKAEISVDEARKIFS